MRSAVYSGCLHVVNIPAAVDPVFSRCSCLTAACFIYDLPWLLLKRDILNLVRTRMHTAFPRFPAPSSARPLPTPSLFLSRPKELQVS